MDKHRLLKKLGAEGILTVDDLPDLDSQRGRVLALMSDKQWHSAQEILSISRGSEGLRRLRELRELKGIKIERMRAQLWGAKRVWLYRLADEDGVQLSLVPRVRIT